MGGCILISIYFDTLESIQRQFLQMSCLSIFKISRHSRLSNEQYSHINMSALNLYADENQYFSQ